MSCTDIAKYFLHFLICRGTVFAVPWYFCFGTFCPKVKARSVSAGPQTTGFGDAPQQAFWQAFWQAFLPPPGAKFRVCSHSNCLPKTQVWLHLPCLPISECPTISVNSHRHFEHTSFYYSPYLNLTSICHVL